MGRDLDSKPMRAEFARQTADLAPMSLGLPDFRVSDASLRALGIGETELAAIQRASMEMR